VAENDKDIGRLEGRVDALEDWMRSIDGKVDQLLAAAHMGKGAWLAILRAGSAVVALAAGMAWIWEQFSKVK
jgi:2',3'-cyclic-nucleotide 2'-phosphodiesterase (5'-nucleotidase family)